LSNILTLSVLPWVVYLTFYISWWSISQVNITEGTCILLTFYLVTLNFESRLVKIISVHHLKSSQVLSELNQRIHLHQSIFRLLCLFLLLCHLMFKSCLYIAFLNFNTPCTVYSLLVFGPEQGQFFGIKKMSAVQLRRFKIRSRTWGGLLSDKTSILFNFKIM
jgi:hypothetical protein